MQAALYSLLSNHAVRILQNGEIKGSGFLLVPKEGYSAYILTAAHLFSESRDHVSIQFLGVPDQCSNTHSIAKEDIITHTDFDQSAFTDSVPYCDAALIKIAAERWMDEIAPVYWGIPEVGMPIQAVGFSAVNCDPMLPHASASHHTVIRVYTPNDHRISATIRGDFILNYADLDTDIQGMSGTVFAAQGQDSIVMIGMIVTTTSLTAAHGQLNLVDMTGIRELLEAQGVVLEQKVILPITHVDENSFSYMIDQIKPKEHSENVFHYLNPNIGFWGRDAEINALEDFLEDDREIAFLGIVAPGGCGKSKLAYEFMRLHKDDPNWKMVFLGKGHINRLLSFPHYSYPQNLLLIVDYAGLHARILGEWLYHLSTLRSECKPSKIRLLMLERDQTVDIDTMVIQAAWLRDLRGNGTQAKTLEQFLFISKAFPQNGNLLPLDDNALLELMSQYASQHGHPLPDGIAKRLLNYLKQKESGRSSSSRPLVAMFITDAYIHGHPVTSWNPRDILEHFIERTKGHWDRISRDNSDLRTSIENCVTFATLVGSLQLDSAPSFLSEDIQCIERLGDEQLIATVCGINQCADFDDTIYPMEPDIVGEYFLFQRMKLMAIRKSKLREMMSAAWLDTDNCFAALGRSIHDYGDHGDFADFYVTNLDILMPPNRNCQEIEAHARLLHKLQHRLRGVERHKIIAGKMRELHEKYPDNLTVSENYAASLMLQWYIYLWKWWEQEANVDALFHLHCSYPQSDYICVMYGKSLFNQIESCIHAISLAQNAETRQKCLERIAFYFTKLNNLCNAHPQNHWLQESLDKASFVLCDPVLKILDQ